MALGGMTQDTGIRLTRDSLLIVGPQWVFGAAVGFAHIRLDDWQFDLFGLLATVLGAGVTGWLYTKHSAPLGIYANVESALGFHRYSLFLAVVVSMLVLATSYVGGLSFSPLGNTSIWLVTLMVVLAVGRNLGYIISGMLIGVWIRRRFGTNTHQGGGSSGRHAA